MLTVKDLPKCMQGVELDKLLQVVNADNTSLFGLDINKAQFIVVTGDVTGYVTVKFDDLNETFDLPVGVWRVQNATEAELRFVAIGDHTVYGVTYHDDKTGEGTMIALWDSLNTRIVSSAIATGGATRYVIMLWTERSGFGRAGHAIVDVGANEYLTIINDHDTGSLNVYPSATRIEL